MRVQTFGDNAFGGGEHNSNYTTRWTYLNIAKNCEKSELYVYNR